MSDATPPITAEDGAKASGPFAAWIHDAVGRPIFWISVIGVLVGLTWIKVLSSDLPPVPPVYADLPAFTLTDQDGREFTKDNMEGRVWIVDFIFTRCPTVCSTLSERMSELQVRLKNTGGDVRLLSVSVDPEHDTPEVLKEYASKFRWQPWKWTWVTGPLGAIDDVVVKGFKIAIDRDEKAPDDIFGITHGSKFVLVDRWSRIRGFYDAEDEDERRLMRDVNILANLERYRPRTDAFKKHATARPASTKQTPKTP